MHTVTGLLILIRQLYKCIFCTITTWIYWHILHVLKYDHTTPSPWAGRTRCQRLSSGQCAECNPGKNWFSWIADQSCKLRGYPRQHAQKACTWNIDSLRHSPAKLQTRKQPQSHAGGCRCKSSDGKRCSGTCSMEGCNEILKRRRWWLGRGMRPFAFEWKGFVAMFQLGERLERVLYTLCVGILTLFAQRHTNTAFADDDGLCHPCPC